MGEVLDDASHLVEVVQLLHGNATASILVDVGELLCNSLLPAIVKGQLTSLGVSHELFLHLLECNLAISIRVHRRVLDIKEFLEVERLSVVNSKRPRNLPLPVLGDVLLHVVDRVHVQRHLVLGLLLPLRNLNVVQVVDLGLPQFGDGSLLLATKVSPEELAITPLINALSFLDGPSIDLLDVLVIVVVDLASQCTDVLVHSASDR